MSSILNILRVGASAGGARPKVVVAINDEASEIRSGQVGAPEGFDHWILKLDGISDESLGDPAGYGRIEYAYHKMARAADRWRLSPAYDVIYAHNPSGAWTGRHQMSINGKRDHFSKEDLEEVGRQINIKGLGVIIDEILDAVSNWPGFARDAGVPPSRITSIGAAHRLFRREDKIYENIRAPLLIIK